MLTIWALGASPETIRVQYDREDKRQRPMMKSDESLVQSFDDKRVMLQHMYIEDNYASFLVYFQRQIAAKGVATVLDEYVFHENKVARSLLSRLFSGLVHPIIHLGFGVEFEQPAIIAQALAQASVHQDYLGETFFVPMQKHIESAGIREQVTLIQIMDLMRADKDLRQSAQHGDTDVFANGLLKRAPNAVIDYCSRWTVPEDQIEEKFAEMINTASECRASARILIDARF